LRPPPPTFTLFPYTSLFRSMHFASLGFNVTSVDSSAALLDLAKAAAQKSMDYQDTIEWHCATFQDIIQKDWQRQFTAIWACASLDRKSTRLNSSHVSNAYAV